MSLHQRILENIVKETIRMLNEKDLQADNKEQLLKAIILAEVMGIMSIVGKEKEAAQEAANQLRTEVVALRKFKVLSSRVRKQIITALRTILGIKTKPKRDPSVDIISAIFASTTYMTMVTAKTLPMLQKVIKEKTLDLKRERGVHVEGAFDTLARTTEAVCIVTTAMATALQEQEDSRVGMRATRMIRNQLKGWNATIDSMVTNTAYWHVGENEITEAEHRQDLLEQQVIQEAVEDERIVTGKEDGPTLAEALLTPAAKQIREEHRRYAIHFRMVSQCETWREIQENLETIARHLGATGFDA